MILYVYIIKSNAHVCAYKYCLFIHSYMIHLCIHFTERACAASHLKVWRTIATIRETLFHPINSSNSGHPNLNGSSNNGGLNKSDKTSVSNDDNDSRVSDSNDNNGKTSSPKKDLNTDDLVEISRGCFRLSRRGGGWIPVHLSAAENKNKKKAPTVYENGLSHSGGDDTDWYLILEDDAEAATTNVMSEGFQVTLNKIIQQKVPNNFDICYLGHVIPHNADKKFFRGGDIIKTKYAWCLHAYILRGKSVDILLKKLPINAPVDNFIAQMLSDDIIEVRFSCVEFLTIIRNTYQISRLT